MPRQPTLRKKGRYWHTEAGNPSGVRFGRIADVSFAEAKRRFADYLKSLGTKRTSRGTALTVEMLMHEFLEWVERKRSFRTYDERRRHLNRFCAFRIGSGLLADLNAIDMTAAYLEGFIEFVKMQYLADDFTADKHAVSVKAMFNWATKHPSPETLLPNVFRPFASVEKYKHPPSPLLEDDLPTPEEVTALMKWADADLEPVRENGDFRQRRPDEYRRGDLNPYRGFEDMLRCYYHTGVRTGELAKCEVRHFNRMAKQLVLGEHKRSRTLRDATSRRIATNAVAYEILSRWCHGKSSKDRIFVDPKGRPWDTRTLAHRFSAVRKLASVRTGITIYSFRHMWISHALMSGTDVATVAKMAGTSINMIEKVYGHFSNDHFEEAQHRLDQRRRSQSASQPAA